MTPTAALLAVAGLAAAIVLILLVRGIWQRPQRGLLLLAALVPFQGLLLILPLPTIAAGWKEAVVVLATVSAFAQRRPRPASGSAMTWPYAAALWGGLGLVSAVAVHHLSAVIGLKVSFFYLLLVLVQRWTPLTARDRDRLVTILMVDGGITAVWGIVQQGLGGARLHAMGYAYNDVIRTAGSHLRSFSTFNQPFPFAFFLMTVLLVCVPIALADHRRLRNRVFLLATPVLAVGLVTAIVRAAIIGLIVGLVVFAFRRRQRLLLAIPAAALVLAFVPGTVTSALLSSTSLGERSTTWVEQTGQVLRHPFGNGVGSTGSAAQKAQDLSGGLSGYAATDTSRTASINNPAAPAYIQPDNAWFATAYELGVLGLFLMALTFAMAFADCLRAHGRLPARDQPWADGLVSLVAAVAVAALFATYLEIFPDDLFFWLLLGVGAALPGRAAPEAANTARPLAAAHSS